MNYEISARRVAKEIGIEISEMTDANCCGLPIDSVNHEMMTLLSARNLCLAEKMELDIMTLCNGCTGVLMKVNKKLKEDRELRKKVNHQLSSIGMEFQGKIKVKHFAQILADIDVNILEQFITKPLHSLTIAGYIGCHIFRPSEFMEVNNPENPSLLDALIKLTGAQTVRYVDEFQCCGYVEGAIDPQIPLFLAREKLRNAKKAGADALVTICPSCHQVLDANQRRAERKFSEIYDLPILHYPQLLGLAMGISHEELGFKELRVKPVKLLESLM
jgi:heterodisulfide reductase subunit B